MTTVSVSKRMDELRQKISKEHINMIDVQMMKMWIKELEATGLDSLDVQNTLTAARNKIDIFVNR